MNDISKIKRRLREHTHPAPEKVKTTVLHRNIEESATYPRVYISVVDDFRDMWE